MTSRKVQLRPRDRYNADRKVVIHRRGAFAGV